MMMMMTADSSSTCGWLGTQHPNGFKSHSSAMPSPPASQQHKPLRHGIDAILHKAPPVPLSANHGWPQKPTLPHIETLRRRAESAVLTSSSTWDGVSLSSCVVPLEDDGESRADPSSRSSSDSSDEQEDIVVVDDAHETISVENDSRKKRSPISDRKESQNIVAVSERQIQEAVLARGGSTRCVGLPPLKEILPATRSAFKASVDSSAHATQGSFEKVKSAFKPIVRPWLLENGCPQPCSNDVVMKVPAYREPFRAVGSLQAKDVGLRSLDAISMLRKKSSVFRVTSTNSRPQPHKSHNSLTALTSSAMDNGQPLPSSLSSWFSWLRSGGLHFGSHPSSQHFSPGALPPCRAVMSASGGVPAPLPPQAPRYNCEACGKSYSTFGGLSKHKQFHCAAQIKKDFRCKFCDKSYSSLGALKMHIRTHTLPCKCTVCGKAFSRPWLLQGHLRTHTGEKPFSCPHCARAFADRSNLRAHLQTHSDVKKYSCRHCSKTFSRMSLLAKHRESSCLGLHS